MGLTRRKSAAAAAAKGPAGAGSSSQKQLLHPGGHISSSPKAGEKGSLLSLSALVTVVAVAMGVGLGLAHKHQGLDLADSILDLMLARAPRTGPAPSIEAVGGGPMTGVAGARQQPAPRKAKGLAGPITVSIHGNGESRPLSDLTLRPEEHKGARDLRQSAGTLWAPCAAVESGCRVFDRYGYEVRSLSALREGDSLFLVPADRLFVWPTFHVGHRVEVPGVASAYPGKRVTLETLSESPRVFLVENFLSEQDADDLIEFTLGIDDEVFGLKRSTTGAKGSEVRPPSSSARSGMSWGGEKGVIASYDAFD